MQFRLARDCDVERPCCNNLARVVNGRLFCAHCKRPRGKLPDEAVTWLLRVLEIFPGAKDQVHLLRETPEEERIEYPYSTLLRGEEIGNSSAQDEDEND